MGAGQGRPAHLDDKLARADPGDAGDEAVPVEAAEGGAVLDRAVPVEPGGGDQGVLGGAGGLEGGDSVTQAQRVGVGGVAAGPFGDDAGGVGGPGGALGLGHGGDGGDHVVDAAHELSVVMGYIYRGCEYPGSGYAKTPTRGARRRI